MNYCKPRYEFILMVWGLLVFSNLVYSQSYLVHTYTEDDGLPSSAVYDITQDNSGRMWFATRSGIAVYDGCHWKTYTIADGLPFSDYSKIKADRQGTIWAANRSAGLNVIYFDGENWLSLPYEKGSNKSMESITSFELTSSDDQTVLAAGTRTSGLYIWRGSQWHHLTPKDGLLSSSVNAIAACEGQFYVATDRGLSVIKGNKIDNSLNQILTLPSPEIIGIAIENQRSHSSCSNNNFILWLQGKGWTGYLKTGKFELLPSAVNLRSVNHLDYLILQPDYRDGLYFGNPAAIFHLNRKTGLIKHVGKENGLIAEGTTSMLMDRENNLWVASLRGVSKLSSMRFANYRKEHGLLKDEVTAILEVVPGTIVFGHSNGLTYFDGNKFRRIPFSKGEFTNDAKYKVLDIRRGPQGNIWVAVEYLGIAKINANGVISWYKIDESARGKISSVLADKAGRVWAGGYKGIHVLQGETFIPVKGDKISNRYVRRIFERPDGSICLATNEGLFVSGQDGWKEYLSSQGGAADNVYAFLTDSRGKSWVGTLAGLFVLDHDILKKVNQDGFEINRPVYFIIEDKKKRLWFGTDKGVIRWDGQSSREYTIHNGLAGQETNRAAGFVDSEGRVWIGTDKGVSRYQEEFDRLSARPPLVELLFLEVSGKRKSLRKVNNLSYSENNLVFHFRGISFIDENAVRYKSKLEGFDEDWLPEYQSYDHQIKYTHLPPGRYRFHLQAKNAAGVWSPAISSSEIIIQSPFWRGWWFYMLFFLLFGFVFYSVQRYFSVKRYSSMLEKQVRERTGQLTESELRFRGVFENAAHAIALADLDGRLFLLNARAEEMLGYSQGELLHKSVMDLTYPDDRELSRKKLRMLLDGKIDFYRIEQRCLKKDGGVMWVDLSVRPIRDTRGRIEAVIGLVVDITDRKRAEKELQESEEKFQKLSQASFEGIVIHDKGKILEANQCFADMFGYKLSEVKGMHALDFTAPESRDIVLKKITSGSEEPFEAVALRKAGTTFPVEIRGKAIRYQGRVLGVVALRDFTQLKQAEKALLESETWYRVLVESINDGLGQVDENQIITYVNDRMCKMLGYSKSELIGRPGTSFIRDYNNERGQNLLDLRKKGINQPYELELERKDGTKIAVLVSPKALFDADGNYAGTFAVCTDITERKRAEEKMKAALKEKEVLLREIHHRVKNNLQIIDSLFDLQTEQIRDGEVLELFRRSQHRLKTIALIHEQLYQSKDLAKINFSEYIQSLIENLFQLYKINSDVSPIRTNVEEVTLSIDSAIPCGLIINELVSNALKYAFPEDKVGEIKIELRIVDADKLSLVVSDNGVGLPEGLDFRNTKSLGLQLVCILTDQLDGSIELDRKRGTTFKITFKAK